MKSITIDLISHILSNLDDQDWMDTKLVSSQFELRPDFPGWFARSRRRKASIFEALLDEFRPYAQ